MSEMLTDSEVTATFNDLEMMRRHHLWPNPVLPLKQRGTAFEGPTLGVLYRSRVDGTYRFWLGSILASAPPDELVISGGDLLLTTLVSSGWVVD